MKEDLSRAETIVVDATSTELQRANELEDTYFLLSAIPKVKLNIPLPDANAVEEEFPV